MRKLYTTPEYKKRQERKLKKLERKYANKIESQYNTRSNSNKIFLKNNIIDNVKRPIVAPPDLRLIEQTEACLLFFRSIRNIDNHILINNTKLVLISLEEVEQIDYGTISILTAIIDELKYKGIILQGGFPIDKKSRDFLFESGFLDKMFDSKTGKSFKKSKKSELIFFEQGCGKLSLKQNKRISETVKNVVNHLTKEYKQCLAVKSIILEICGNSIEWSGTENKQWLLGVKYENDKVIFTVTDIGKGILETLHKKFDKIIIDFLTNKKDHEILIGAFKEKYGSTTQEKNRNKGLPAVKLNFDNDLIRNLKVLTNNVILHFDNENETKTFKKGSARFKGTFYQWEMSKESLNNINLRNENVKYI